MSNYLNMFPGGGDIGRGLGGTKLGIFRQQSDCKELGDQADG